MMTGFGAWARLDRIGYGIGWLGDSVGYSPGTPWIC